MAHILLLEENSSLAQKIGWALAHNGHELQHVNSPTLATHIAELTKPDLILVNTPMTPTKEQIKAVEQLRDLFPEIPLTLIPQNFLATDDPKEKDFASLREYVASLANIVASLPTARIGKVSDNLKITRRAAQAYSPN